MMYSPSRLILITGPKHSGKSLCSRALGKISGLEVVDLDDLIEKQTGKTPRTLFGEGPEIFRKAEALALASLIRLPEPSSAHGAERQPEKSLIVAAGGGLADNEEALALLSGLDSMRREIITVYLDVSAETTWQRIAAAGELPPFLNTENPKETHFALHKRRTEFYKVLAQITIFAENKSPDQIAGEILLNCLTPGACPGGA